jgi:hypothetical protein
MRRCWSITTAVALLLTVSACGGELDATDRTPPRPSYRYGLRARVSSSDRSTDEWSRRWYAIWPAVTSCTRKLAERGLATAALADHGQRLALVHGERTSSTALTCPTVRRRNPSVIGKCTLRFSTSRMGSTCAERAGAGAVTASPRWLLAGPVRRRRCRLRRWDGHPAHPRLQTSAWRRACSMLAPMPA